MYTYTDLSMSTLCSVLPRMERTTAWNISWKCRCCWCCQSIAWRYTQANKKYLFYSEYYFFCSFLYILSDYYALFICRIFYWILTHCA